MKTPPVEDTNPTHQTPLLEESPCENLPVFGVLGVVTDYHASFTCPKCKLLVSQKVFSNTFRHDCGALYLLEKPVEGVRVSYIEFGN